MNCCTCHLPNKTPPDKKNFHLLHKISTTVLARHALELVSAKMVLTTTHAFVMQDILAKTAKQVSLTLCSVFFHNDGTK